EVPVKGAGFGLMFFALAPCLLARPCVMANKWARNFLMASLAAGASLSLGQVTIQSSVYQQNFNSLSATGDSNNWTNNVTLEGWYAFRTPSGGATVAVGAYRASDGNFANGALMSYGQNGSGDR